MSFDSQPGFLRLRSIIAERTNRIVVWIGAGLSIPAGLPSWSLLKEHLCTTLANKDVSLDPVHLANVNRRVAQIRESTDYWLSFDMLRQNIGHATYRAAIRESLKNADTCEIPENYLSIFDLPVTGIINLNLDRLATRAFTQRYPGKAVIEFGGFQAAEHSHVLKSSTPFIANLHGIQSDEKSWVLGRDQLRSLLKNEGYRSFVRSCLSSRTVIFLGISADDVAVGGHLEALTDRDVDLGDHFWITHRSDEAADFWAERVQLQRIRYKSVNGDHSELGELLSALTNYEPVEEVAAPVVMNSIASGIDLPAPSQLRMEVNPEKIREVLNAEAAKLLQPVPESDHIQYEAYNLFCAKYDEAIYRAWYVSTAPGGNSLFGYTLEQEIADGAFGRVFFARDKLGAPVAVKVLKEEVRRKPEMLQSFRRGVRSMRILAERQVIGMIPYEEASEIPATAVMEFVEGPNLQVAVESGFCEDWSDVLEIAVQIAHIIRRAHLLPERVLHRDLRPPNIMLRDYYERPVPLNVVILDFDLSWHLGAQEVSVIDRSSLGGFLAPEQVDPASEMSTRSASVDSFGLGMTLYFLRTGREPQYLQHRHKDWNGDLNAEALRHPCAMWQSVPARFFRLILNCTKDQQTDRWDMGQIEGELELLKQCVLKPESVRSGELIAEELAQRIVNTGGFVNYHWDHDRLTALLDFPSGVEIAVKSDENARLIILDSYWSNRGDRNFRNVKKYLKPALDNAISSLRAKGWKLLPQTSMKSTEAGFALSIGISELAVRMQLHTDEIVNALKRFNF